jgi:hypothetical protein
LLREILVLKVFAQCGLLSQRQRKVFADGHGFALGGDEGLARVVLAVNLKLNHDLLKVLNLSLVLRLLGS